ncbi:Superoxide dismutase [Cu-Zn] [Chamberlinius hualienensis]
MKFSLAIATAVFALYLTTGNAAPTNSSSYELAQDVYYLKRNVSQIYGVLIGLKAKVDELEHKHKTHTYAAWQEKARKFIKEFGDEDDDDDDDDKDEDQEKKVKKVTMIHGQNVTELPNTTHAAASENLTDTTATTITTTGTGNSNVSVNKSCVIDGPTQPQSKLYPEKAAERRDDYVRNITGNNVTGYCSLRPNKALPPGKRMDIRGKIYMFEAENEPNKLTVSIKLSGLMPSNSSTDSQRFKHGYHIHEFGNLNNGCESTGVHYNPFNKTHGSPTAITKHFGDLGNIETDPYGSLNQTLEYTIPQALSGPFSFIGRGLVIHEKVDDLGSIINDTGSQTTGNSGTRLACCVIYKLH